jgi:hypothetical protein
MGQAGIAFGQQCDSPYLPTAAGPSGYHLMMDAAGNLMLYNRTQESIKSALLVGIDTAPPKPGAWMQFKVDVTPHSIMFARLDGRQRGATVSDAAPRGGYFSLCKNYQGRPGVEFRHIRVSVG